MSFLGAWLILALAFLIALSWISNFFTLAPLINKSVSFSQYWLLGLQAIQLETSTGKYLERKGAYRILTSLSTCSLPLGSLTFRWHLPSIIFVWFCFVNQLAFLRVSWQKDFSSNCSIIAGSQKLCECILILLVWYICLYTDQLKWLKYFNFLWD